MLHPFDLNLFKIQIVYCDRIKRKTCVTAVVTQVNWRTCGMALATEILKEINPTDTYNSSVKFCEFVGNNREGWTLYRFRFSNVCVMTTTDC